MVNSKRVHGPWFWSLGLSVTVGILPLVSATMPAIAQPTSWASILNILLGKTEPRDPGKGGTGGPRPDDFCGVTLQQTHQLWHTQPLFLWQGNPRHIGVRLKGASTVLWRGSALAQSPPGLRQLRYGGDSLQPGQTYEWLFFFDQTSTTPQYWIPFQVMNDHDRATIAADLQTLENPLKAQNATAEAIALQRANYFAQRQLWADMLQEIYSVPNPSPELKQMTQTLPGKVCTLRSNSERTVP